MPEEFFEESVKDCAERVDGNVGSNRWEVITALFGWAGAIGTILGFIGSLLGVEYSGYILSGGIVLIGIAFKRDFYKMIITG